MECKVRSVSRPVAKWSKDGSALPTGSTFQDIFSDLGDGTFLCQLEIRVNFKINIFLILLKLVYIIFFLYLIYIYILYIYYNFIF